MQFLKIQKILNILTNSEIINELKKKVAYIIFKNKLQASLPCIDVISFDKKSL